MASDGMMWKEIVDMSKTELHQYVSENTGNESNICQIYAMKGEKPLF